ncbi:MAG: hypothetical protein HQ546_06010, partial [Planctomycetes bacterium]|nr:hypothetical protein [Planctomycetota bacterium]
VTIDGNALSLRVNQALALIPPESGSIGTLNVGGDAKVRGGNQNFAYTNRVLYSRPDNTYSLAELRLLDQPGMRWEYEQFFDSSDGPGWLTTNATVEKGQGDPTSHVLYSPLGDGDVRNVWIEDADGLNTTSMRINWGQNNSLQLGFIHPLAATPQMIRMGTRYSARERFEGGLVFRSLAETITAAVSGTAKVTNRMFDHGFVTVPAGTYWAVRGQTVTSIKGNVEFEYQDAFYRGRLTVTLRENWWASPTDGTIKSVTKMTIKVTAPRGIRLSHTVQSERELVNTDITYVTGVPAYENWFGNMPTAVGILAGYYDGVGYEDLIDGDASTQTDEVNNAIATEGAGGEYLFTDAGAVIVSPGTPGTGHIPDYALYDEIDDTDPAYFPYYDDLSDPDVVTETGISPHEDDCIADFLLTSRSIEGSVLGDGFFDDVAAGVENYFQHMGYTATAEHVDGEDFTWDDLVAEIDAGRPVLVDVDPNSYGMSEQLMVVFAYDLGSQQYGGYNTEDGDLHWYSFGAGESTSLDIIDAVLVRVE